jgi:hypothetical protein
MSANLVEQFRQRKPQRRPWDEEKPEGRGVPLANASRFLQAVQDPQMAPAPPQPEQPAYEPPTVPMAGKVRAQPASGEEDANNSRFIDALARANPDLSPPSGYVGEGVPSGAGELTQRPRWTSPLNQETEHNLALQDQVEHPEKAHGWKRWVIPMAARAAQGIAATGSVGGGIGGAIEGLVEGTVSPSSANQITFAQKLAASNAHLGQLQAQGEAAFKRAQEAATLHKTVAETQRILNPLPQTEVVKVKGQGSFLVNKQTGKQTKIDLPDEVNPEEWEQAEANGLLYWKNKRTQETKPMTYGGSQLRNDADVPVPYKPTADSPTFMVRPADAVRGATDIEGANINAGAKAGEYQMDAANANSQREWDAAKSQIDRDNQVTKDRYARAEVDTKALRDAITAAATKAALANNPPPHRAGDKIYDAAPEDVARYKDEAKAAVAKVHALAATVRQNYPDLVGDDELSWPTVLKAAPEPKAYPTPPRVQARPAPAKRTGGPVSTSAKPITADSTEAEVRAEAKRRGKDESAAVEKWRKMKR